MSSSHSFTPNIMSQRRYIVEWFTEFSDMQKTDFLAILVLRFANKSYVNGLLPGMESCCNLEDRPPTIFQCRMKLFMEWTETWSQEDKDFLLQKIKEIDPAFSTKYDKEIAAGEVLDNGGNNICVSPQSED